MKDDLGGFLFETLIKSLKVKYSLACKDQVEAHDFIRKLLDDPDNNIKPIYFDKYKKLRTGRLDD